MGETKVTSYHEYKKQLKKLSEEIKKESRKSSNKKKKSEHLLNLEKELSKLNTLYNRNDNENEELKKTEDNEKGVNNLEDIVNGNLYSYNEKPSKKSLKRKEKLKALEKEAEERELENQKNNYGEREYEQLLEHLKKIQKTIYFIAPDGNCLYESIIHQLKKRSTDANSYTHTEKSFLNYIGKQQLLLKDVQLKLYEEGGEIAFDFSFYPFMNPSDLNSDMLRFLTAVYLMQNKSIFENYVFTNEEEEDAIDDAYLRYCQNIIDGAYGSELEIKALSEIFKKKIVVYDINMNISYGEDYSDSLHICFHHKLYALGKHYNSVVDLPE